MVQTENGHRYVVLMIDSLTRWPEAYPTANITAETVANCVAEYIARHGAMRILLSDRGAQFRSELVDELCTIFQVTKKFTLAYNPRCNGLVERFGRTLKTAISCYVNKQQTNWDVYVNHLLFAYRTSNVQATGFTPFELMYGHKALIPTDAVRFHPVPIHDRLAGLHNPTPV